MSETYSSEFKAKVALEAVNKDDAEIKKIAAKHGVSEEDIKNWISLLVAGVSQLFPEEVAEEQPAGEDVELSTDDEELANAVNHGVMSDSLNYRKLTFWAALGTSIVVIFVIGLVIFSQYSLFEAQKNASSQTTFADVNELHAKQKQELNSFGVVDIENGLYRIPIDSAINRIATD
jgi:transposase-like protein